VVRSSLRYNPVPASVKIDLELHKPYRTWFHRTGSPFARLHLYRAEWCATLRRTAREKATGIWVHAARHEAEVEG
jgi:hypothetical protein